MTWSFIFWANLSESTLEKYLVCSLGRPWSSGYYDNS